jgi:hypothetical protein
MGTVLTGAIFKKSSISGFYKNGNHIGTNYKTGLVNGKTVRLYRDLEDNGCEEVDLSTITLLNEYDTDITPSTNLAKAEVLSSIVSSINKEPINIGKINGRDAGSLFGNYSR